MAEESPSKAVTQEVDSSGKRRLITGAEAEVEVGVEAKTLLPSKRLKSSNTPSAFSACTSKEEEDALITKYLHKISIHPTLTASRRKTYRVLLSIPRGRWTTYSALSRYLNSSPRAVGNSMRLNPFSPHVPCHRVLASDRTIGGYKGAWGTGGLYAEEKTKLLVGEGIVFDEKGRAAGKCFEEFNDIRGV